MMPRKRSNHFDPNCYVSTFGCLTCHVGFWFQIGKPCEKKIASIIYWPILAKKYRPNSLTNTPTSYKEDQNALFLSLVDSSSFRFVITRYHLRLQTQGIFNSAPCHMGSLNLGGAWQHKIFCWIGHQICCYSPRSTSIFYFGFRPCKALSTKAILQLLSSV